LRTLVEEAKGVGPERDESPVLASLDPSRVAKRVKRFQTSEASEPRNTNVATVWSDFENTRRALREVILSGDGLALGNVHAPHPTLGPLSGYAWIAFVGSHAARHADQIREDAG
jgi:hypothetical protein